MGAPMGYYTLAKFPNQITEGLMLIKVDDKGISLELGKIIPFEG